MKKIALIVAGGRGTRMGAGIPKQFLLIDGRPVLMHTIEAFYRYDHEIFIILVLPEKQADIWNELCKKHCFEIKHRVRFGGETRFHSVKRNLNDIPDDSLIAIHDGVRPLVSEGTISRCFSTAETLGSAVPCVDIPETLRKYSKNTSEQVNRNEYKLIQTPQVFVAAILKKAYDTEYRIDFTDDAGVVEKAGYPITLVEGNPENIKITFEKDLVVASALLKAGQSQGL